MQVLKLRDINGTPTIVGSNTLVLPIVSQVVGPDYRPIRPEELETTLQEGDPLNIRGNHYIDTGLVLDFSGKNHELARKLFERLPKKLKDFDRLPAVLVGYGLENSKFGDYGVIPVYQEGTELRTAKILTEPTAQFKETDPQLVQSGLPSRLGTGTRWLYNSTQGESSKDNLGLSRLFLNYFLNLGSSDKDLAGSNELGRVVSVRAEGATPGK